MITNKTFIAISSEIYNNKLVLLNTSCGLSIANQDGLTAQESLDFLFNLIHKRDNQKGVVFINYAFSRDNEFIFSLLPDTLKDKLFQSQSIKKQLAEIEQEQEDNDDKYYTILDSEYRELLDFEKYVNKLSKEELLDVQFLGYNLTLVNGKFLTIRKNKKSITIYDCFGFFREPLFNAAQKWLNEDIELLKINTTQKQCLFNFTIIESLRAFSDLECQTIVRLMNKLNVDLVNYGFNLTRFHGASCISSYMLSKSKARKEYHSYKYRRQMSYETWKAHKQAYYGGRIEQFKIGTLTNINVYDINSAYAYSMLFLPKMLRKPIFSRTYNTEPFSLWFVEYDFSNSDNYFGLLPNRTKKGNFTTYKSTGSGYYYQPEIEFLLTHYPNNINIKQGFYFPFEIADFPKEIFAVYELRKQLKQQSNPLEKVIKLALASLYGKFCQVQGKSHFYNFFYAGYITSKTRALMLQATKNFERETVCFLTDAIHTTTKLRVPVSDEIGEFSLKQYEKGNYFNAGVYRLFGKDGNIKTASQGYSEFDFDNALLELKKKQVFTALQEFFTGWNIYTDERITKGKNYLDIFRENKQTNPFESSARLFNACEIDFSQSYIDSQIVKLYGGIESGLYKENIYKESNKEVSSLLAKRV